MVYSKAPWTAEQDAANSIQICDANGKEIASVLNPCEDELSEESRGDAKLMILAPQMYQLLKSVTEIEQTTGSPCPLCGGGFQHRNHCIIPLAQKLIGTGG